MIWANFLHIYQPPSQLPDIFDRIVFESYRPIIKGLFKHPQAKITLNINGVLTAKLAKSKKHKDIIQDLKKLANLGRIEFVASANNHAFLPLLPESEITRQIVLNEKTNSKYFGKAYQPTGFFSPEMAYSDKVAKVAKKLGYQWMLVDELAFNGQEGQVDFSKIYKVKGLENFSVLFKERRASKLIVEAIVRSGASLRSELKQQMKQNRYLITAMDGETFGHHRPGLEELLYDIFAQPQFKKVFISDIINKFPGGGPIKPLPSTWSIFSEDLKNKLPYKLWWDTKNELHKVQWDFTNLLIKENAKSKGHKDYRKIRARLDLALASCYYWWASKYWWSLEIIEQGAYDMKNVLAESKLTSKKIKGKAANYYRQILDIAFNWQRTGEIRRFHMSQENWQTKPFKERTHPEWFNQMILEFEAEMKKAAQNQEYEQAIKWRDAIIKLRSGADVFDILHVVNELWTVRKIPSSKPFLQQKRFSKFAKKYFLPLESKSKDEPKGTIKKILDEKFIKQLFSKAVQTNYKTKLSRVTIKVERNFLRKFETLALRFTLYLKNGKRVYWRGNATIHDQSPYYTYRAFTYLKKLGYQDMVPLIFDYRKSLNLLYYQEMPGKTIQNLIDTKNIGNLENLVKKTAQLLKKIHQIHPDKKDIPLWTKQMEKKERLKEISLVKKSYKNNRGRFQKIFQELERKRQKLSNYFNNQKNYRLCHGDFHPGNVLIHKDKLSVIDFGSARYYEPCFDVARFTIQLELMIRLQFKKRHAEIVKPLQQLFLKEYFGKSMGKVDRFKVKYYEIRHLQQIASIISIIELKDHQENAMNAFFEIAQKRLKKL